MSQIWWCLRSDGAALVCVSVAEWVEWVEWVVEYWNGWGVQATTRSWDPELPVSCDKSP
jgi:hypothetical protein